MSKILTPPNKLQVGTDLNKAMPLINQNFDELASSFNGFSVELAAISSGGSLVASGDIGGLIGYSYIRDQADDLVFMQPTISIYVDTPVGFDPYNPDSAYLFPNGTALTADAIKLVKGNIVTMTYAKAVYPSSGLTYALNNRLYTKETAPVGAVAYSYGPMIITYIRNVGSLSHNYLAVSSYSSYSRSNSFYR